MRHREDAREILVNKADLIAKIKENKQNHQKEYAEAVEAYKLEALEQLEAQTQALKEGKLDLRLNLVSPVDKSEESDKLVTMFSWEVKDEVTLSQGEFNEYVLDETQFATMAKMS